jgi:signal transduction histidine kinase/CheY-like chemotaxis protein
MYLEKAFKDGECVFEWMNQKLDGTLIPMEVTLIRVAYETGYIAVGYGRDLREYNRMMDEIKHRDDLMQAVNSAAAILLQSEPGKFVSDLHQSMSMIAAVVEADRVRIWKNNTIDGELYCTQVYEWSEGAEPQQNVEYTINMSYKDKLPGWEEKLSCGQCIKGLTSEMQEVIHTHLSAQGIISILVVPIFLQEQFWGMVGFDDCHRERSFTENDESILRSGSMLFVNALHRNELILNIRDTSVQLELALKQANAASKAKGDFLANMSHEMRTPMNAIIGMTTIARNADGIEQKNHALNKIGDASSHLLGVINDVLDMSKIEAEKLELSSIEYNFERMLQKVISVISFRVDEKQQCLSVNIDSDIPRFVTGDDQRLAQVITNLLSNAVKFTPEKGNIHLGAFFTGETDGICELRIEVTDSGIGISPEQHDKIFQAFEQAESGTSRKYGGTGLGLVISKRIVELMGGNIWLESDYGKGAKFIFTVKIGRGEKSPCSMLAPGVNWENIRILVVDDMTETTSQFQDIFGHLGIQCDVAFNGQEAWNIIEERGEYDVFFIDWRMPVMDGIELTKRIKSRGTDRPSVVIMITAADWALIKEEASEAGVDKHILKPLFSSTIIDSINECLGTDKKKKEDITDREGEFWGRRLLVAEDIEINREILIALLENTGLIIDCAENGKEALDTIEANPGIYDLVFMDVQMPKMDGLEATRRIRSLTDHRHKSLPIIAMTANVFKSDIEACLAAGMDEHLGKPLDIDDVIEKLRKYLK